MSNHKPGENPARRKSKVSWATIIVAQETLLFRRAGFSPALWLLIPAFSLDTAPPNLPVRLQR